MAHMVKCTVCGKRFNRDKIQAVKTGPMRYAHQVCFPEGELVPLEVEDPELAELENYIQNLLGEDYNRARVNKQIKDFRQNYDYSYSGMLKTLIWFYDIKGNSKDKANGGIGIIPFVYQDACNYYYSLYLAQIANAQIENFKPVVREITISSPEVYRKPIKMFNVGEDE
jgi:recombinational DNA repair protein (RecF pathway)